MHILSSILREAQARSTAPIRSTHQDRILSWHPADQEHGSVPDVTSGEHHVTSGPPGLNLALKNYLGLEACVFPPL